MTQDSHLNYDPRLLKALAHPLRARVLPLFTEEAVSPIQVARQLDADVRDIAYHVRVLRRLGYIELVETRRRRGALEHFYRAAEPPTGER